MNLEYTIGYDWRNPEIPVKIRQKWTKTRNFHGVKIWVGDPSSGKSAAAKTLASDYHRDHRRFVIFSPTDEWSKIRFSSNAKDIQHGVHDLSIIENFAFKLSDFSSISDWISLGCPPQTAIHLWEVATKKRIHNDDPREMLKYIKQLPTSNTRKNSLDSQTRLFPSVKLAMENRMETFIAFDVFWHPNSTKQTLDWIKVLRKNRYLLINLDSIDVGAIKTRAYVGKIMEKFYKNEKVIKHLNPAFFFEEADLLCPNMSRDTTIWPSSLYWIHYGVLKMQKYGCEFCFITQIPENLHEDIFGSFDYIFWGPIASTSRYYDRFSSFLKADATTGERIWGLEKKGEGKFRQPYIPRECPCLC